MTETSSENIQISMNYASMHEMLNKNFIFLDEVFAYLVAQEIIEHNDIKPRSVKEC